MPTFKKPQPPVQHPVAASPARRAVPVAPVSLVPGLLAHWHYWTAFVSWSIAAFFFMRAYEFFQMKVLDPPTSVEVLRGLTHSSFRSISKWRCGLGVSSWASDS